MSVSLRRQEAAASSIVGPNGELIRFEDLPPPNTRRWVIRRKAEVVAAVRGGLLTVDEALTRYELTQEEFESWRGAFNRHGMAGLRTTQRGDRDLNRGG
jgi:hypothetical protein